MQLTEVDLELLELAAIPVPWPMVCAEFHARYGSAGVLARRLFELRQGLLLEINGEPQPSPQALEADALASGCFEDPNMMAGSPWELVATADGYREVENRLAAQ